MSHKSVRDVSQRRPDLRLPTIESTDIYDCTERQFASNDRAARAACANSVLSPDSGETLQVALFRCLLLLASSGYCTTLHSRTRLGTTAGACTGAVRFFESRNRVHNQEALVSGRIGTTASAVRFLESRDRIHQAALGFGRLLLDV
jgi:hypothetical protein